ncbi:MAG: hypothetical protein HC934_09580 [Acaryochloridaceae cyanobacterium SU_2_1]|nr:hypothetical protein [Acaryochloridaceae cyanobacterium SU_2_1]NJM95248.1 hypothetical protein [Acaryochloridaceae cyanobacterium CSU_5_19]
MSASPSQDDPWKTPSLELDAELLETSERLMAKSRQDLSEQVEHEHPEVEAAHQKIVELEFQKRTIFQRNVRLTAELAQLRADNQRLQDQVVQLERQQRQRLRLFSWLRYLLPQ